MIIKRVVKRRMDERRVVVGVKESFNRKWEMKNRHMYVEGKGGE